MMKKVQILLSSYNGEKYIGEQIDSLLNQDYENISILIRDDGSTDNTVAVLRSYEKQNDCISLIEGNNIGAVASFFELMKDADLSADLFSFCDQDDVWKKNKVSKAVEKFFCFKDEKPYLYFTNLTVTDEHLNIIEDTKSPCCIGPENAIVQNIASGCTMVIDRKLLLLVLDNQPNIANVYMHDWWIYLLASFLGEVVFDSNSYIMYRQHGSNTLGIPLNFWQKKKSKLKYMFNYKGRALRIAHIREFWSVTKNKISPKNELLIQKFFKCQEGFLKRCKISFEMPFRFRSRLSTWKLRLLIILDLY